MAQHTFSDYEHFFGLKERPFKGALDMGFFYESKKACELVGILKDKPSPQLLHLQGPAKVGKSSLLKMLPSLLPDNFVVVSLLNPHLKIYEALRLGLLALGHGHKLAVSKSEESLLGYFHNALKELAAENHHLVLAFDEADKLTPEFLDDFRNILDFEKSFKDNYTIILAACDDSPWPSFGQVAPQILFFEPLDRQELESYVKHRLRAAGARKNYFSKEALDALWQKSGGLPGMVNQLAERALMAAWADGRKEVLGSHLNLAKESLEKPIAVDKDPLAESFHQAKKEPAKGAKQSHKGLGRLVIMGAVLLGILSYFWQSNQEEPLSVNDVAIENMEEASSQALPLSPPDNAALAQSTAVDAPRLPSVPPQLLNLPQGQLTLVIENDKMLGRLWQGTHKGSGLKAELVCPEIADNGLYLFGKPSGVSPLIFRFPPAKQLPREAARDIWPQVATVLPQNILAVMVADSASYVQERDEEAYKVLSSQVKVWVEAQQYSFADTLASLYASSFQFFEVGREERAIKRSDFQKALSSEAKTSGGVKLAISEPLIMQDPANSSLAWAIFNLKYESKLRNDMGVRVLVFEKSTLSQNTWLIVAELWLPEKSLRNF